MAKTLDKRVPAVVGHDQRLSDLNDVDEDHKSLGLPPILRECNVVPVCPGSSVIVLACG